MAEFRIAVTFTASLARLTGDEQKAAKTTAFDLQLDPASPGMQFHRLERARDRSFWSVRVGSDLRLIVHRSEASLLRCYVGHHDDAYRWAERRRIERHPTTGAAQLVEVRETVREIEIPRYVEAKAESAATTTVPVSLFDGVTTGLAPVGLGSKARFGMPGGRVAAGIVVRHVMPRREAAAGSPAR